MKLWVKVDENYYLMTFKFDESYTLWPFKQNWKCLMQFLFNYIYNIYNIYIYIYIHTILSVTNWQQSGKNKPSYFKIRHSVWPARPFVLETVKEMGYLNRWPLKLPRRSRSTNLKIVPATNWLQAGRSKPSHFQIRHSFWPVGTLVPRHFSKYEAI